MVVSLCLTTLSRHCSMQDDDDSVGFGEVEGTQITEDASIIHNRMMEQAQRNVLDTATEAEVNLHRCPQVITRRSEFLDRYQTMSDKVDNWIYRCHWSVMTPEARQLIHQMTEAEVTMFYGCECRTLRNAFMLRQMALHYVAMTL
jgi:hypothetical protein